MSFKISELYIYPIKSLGRIQLQSSTLTPKGLQYDRRWLLTDTNGKFITQRKMSELVFFKIALAEGKKGIVVSHKNAATDLFIPARGVNESDRKMRVTIWDDEVEAVIESPKINDWFSSLIGFEVYLSFLPGSDRQRKVGGGHSDAAIDFPDAAPYLFLGQNALDHLNGKLEKSIPINRFRANIIFEDAPLDQAVEGIINGIFFNQGHVCCAGSRLLVQESVYKEVIEKLKQYNEAIENYKKSISLNPENEATPSPVIPKIPPMAFLLFIILN